MPDSIIFTVIITLSFLSTGFGILAAFFAYKNSHKVEHEIRMVFWGIGAIAGLVFGALCWVWFLIPIIINHL
jgi:Na+-driven multidrug efflux pump